jgi:hypothetical protein
MSLTTSAAFLVAARRQQADDYIACAHRMIDARHTDAARLGAYATSAEALIVANALSREPELVAAIATENGVFDGSQSPVALGLPEADVAAGGANPFAASIPYYALSGAPHPPSLFLVPKGPGRRPDALRMAAALEAAAPKRLAALVVEYPLADNGASGFAEPWADVEAFFRLTLVREGAAALPNYVRDDDAVLGLRRAPAQP